MPPQIDLNTIIVLISCGATIGSMFLNNKVIIKNIEDRVATYKADMEKMIHTEKRHAMDLSSAYIKNIEKDVDEIFPRLRKVEDSASANCFKVSQLEKNCIKHKIREGGIKT